MSFFPIKKKRVYQDIIKQIKHAIQKGEIIPGDKLPSERILAETLSVSRTSVKEAISVLDSAGVVEIKPGIGVFLRNKTSHDIVLQMNDILSNQETNLNELMELRQAIEGDAAFYAALRSNQNEKNRIKKAFINLNDAVRENRIAAEEDYEFHMAICKAAQNSLFIKVMFLISDILLEGLAESRSSTLKIPGRSEQILDEHREIYEAIKNEEPEKARTAMIKHLEGVRNRYLN